MRLASLGVACVLLAAAALAAVETPTTCCFTNPRYSGVCKVAPGQDETCASVLAYLNNPNSTGKEYCGGTAVRTGWTQVDCSTAPKSSAPAAPESARPAAPR